MYGTRRGGRRVRKSPVRSKVAWQDLSIKKTGAGSGSIKLQGVDIPSLTMAVVNMPDGTLEEVIINPNLGPMKYQKDTSMTALTYNHSCIAGVTEHGWGGAHINKRWLAMSKTEQEVVIAMVAKMNRCLKEVMGEEWYEYTRRSAIMEKMWSVMKQIEASLSAPACQGSIGQARDRSENYMAYAKAVSAAIVEFKKPTYAYFGCDDQWLLNMVTKHKDEQGVMQMYNRIGELTAYVKLGPMNVEKGAFLEVHGMPGAEGEKLNGTPVIARYWDSNSAVYGVSPYQNPSEFMTMKPANLRLKEGKLFSSVEEAEAFVNGLYEAYGSKSAQEKLAELASAHWRIVDYRNNVRFAALEVQKSVLQKFGFTPDAFGQYYSQRAMAEFEANLPFVFKCADLGRFGYPTLDFTGRVACVTGGGRGLGRSYCLLLASLGCKVVCNNRTREKADEVVAEIKSKGGEATADYSDVAGAGGSIFDTAISAYGKLDICVMNAGQLEDTLFLAMKQEQFQTIQDTHLHGHVKLLEKVWPHFIKNKYGRLLVTSSTSGVFGNFGQLNYGTSKTALTSLAWTLAMEGYKHNIQTNVIMPNAMTRMTNNLQAAAQRLSDNALKEIPQPVASGVTWLVHEKCEYNGGLWFLEGGSAKPDRLEADESFVEFDPAGGPGQLEVVGAQWQIFAQFQKKSYPATKLHSSSYPVPETNFGDENLNGRRPKPPLSSPLRYDGRVAVVTCGGDGVGRSVSMLLAARGAKVIVNDRDQDKADKVVAEIAKSGGTAIADYSDSGDAAVETAIDQFDRLDILVCYERTLPGEAMFEDITSEQFIAEYNKHVTGHWKVAKKAWMQFYDPRYGRIVLLSSAAGFFGKIGQAINGAKTGAMWGMGQILAMEGAQQSIWTNIIAVEGKNPEADAIPVAYLCHESNASSAQLYNVEGGHVQSLRIQQDEDFAHFDGNRPMVESIKELVAKAKEKPNWEHCSYPAFHMHMGYRR